MAGSALKRNPYFNGEAQRSPQYAPMPQYGQHGGQPGYAPQGGYGGGYPQQPGQQAPYGVPSPQSMDHQFNLPSATPDQMDRMSYPDVIAKTVGLFAALIVTAAVAWFITALNPALGLGLAILGSFGALGLGIALSLSKTPKPALAWIFAICEGLLVGGFSAYLEFVFPGIVVQATLATFAVVATVLVLFRFGKVRTSPRLTKIVMVAMIGYLVFSLFNLGYMFIGPMLGVQDMGMFGIRSMEVFGIPLGLLIGILAVLMGAYMLVMDFELIENGVKAGAPRSFGWIAAYSLVSTVVFIYIEILRIIAILRNN